MTGLYRLLVVALVLLSGTLVYIIVRQTRPRPMLFSSAVSEDSTLSYAARAESLDAIADSLDASYRHTGIIARPGVAYRLGRLNEEIDGLRFAVERWRAAQDVYDRNQSWRECILIYGRASGVCDALKAEGEGEE